MNPAAKKFPNIVDVTVPRGGFLVHNHVLDEQIGEIAQGLHEAGISYMEVCHGRGVGAKNAGYPALFGDRDMLRAARLRAPGMRFTAYFSPYPYSLFEAERIAEYCDYFRLSIEFEEIEKSVANLKNLRATGRPVVAMLERAHRLSPQQVADHARKLQDAGAEIAYLCDSFGTLTPDEVQNYFAPLQKAFSGALGFQALNTTGQASANCLAAVESGAQWLDASLLGLGPSGGMASLEILASLLHDSEGAKSLSLRRLCQSARWFAKPAMRHLPRATAVDLALAKAKLDYYPPELLGILSSILEIDLDAMLAALSEIRPGLIRLREADIRAFLESHGLDFEVVMEFIKTGRVPEAATEAS